MCNLINASVTYSSSWKTHVSHVQVKISEQDLMSNFTEHLSLLGLKKQNPMAKKYLMTVSQGIHNTTFM